MKMTEGREARTGRVYFRIGESHQEKLNEYAANYGVSVSALVAMIVGQWIHQQDKIIAPMLEDLGKTLTNSMVEAIKNSEGQ